MKSGKKLRISFISFTVMSLVLLAFFSSQFTFIHSVQGHPSSTKVYVDPSSILPPVAPTPEEGGKITLRPDGDGTFTEWTGSYTDWDDTDPHDGDTTYVSVDERDKSQSSTIEDPSGAETWEIASVKVVVFARTNVSAPDDLVAPTLVIGGEAEVGTENLMGLPHEDYKIWTNEWGKNPATDDFWTWDELDELEAGVRSKRRQYGHWEGEIRITQLYVEVSGPRFSVDIQVEDVTDLWQYVFEIFYNPDVIQGVWVNPNAPAVIGPFLSSAGGTITKNPGTGWNDTRGWLSITGAYLAEIGDPAKSPDGSGVISTVIFKVVRKGDSELRLGKQTGLMDPNGQWIIHGENLEAGYFRNVDLDLMPKAYFVYTPDIAPGHIPQVPLEGYNVTFDASTTQLGAASRPITTYKWYFRKLVGELTPDLAVFTETDLTVSRNYTERTTRTTRYTAALTVIDADDVVGTAPPMEVAIYAHDVYLLDITTNAPISVLPAGVPYVEIGETLEVTVVAENQGNFTETFDVSCFWSAFYEGETHNGSIGTKQTVTNLGAGATKNLTFHWDTEGRNITHAQKFELSANASRVPYEYDVELPPGGVVENQRAGPAHRIRFHDVALSELTPSEKVVTPGEMVEVDVTVTNQGDFNETNVLVKTWAQKGTDLPIDIGTKTISIMTNKSFSDKYMKKIPPYRDNYTTTLTFDWDTTAVSAGTYTISAEASVVPVEYQITDNVINRAAPVWDEYPVDWDGVAGTDFDMSVLLDMTSVDTVSNVDGSQADMEVSFDITGPSAATRYCYVQVPKDALKGYPCILLLDGVDIACDESTFTRQSTTNMFFYFTAEFASSRTVQIFGPNSYPVDYPEGDSVEYHVGIASDSAVSDFEFSTPEGLESGGIAFDLTGGGYCAVGVPTKLLQPDYTVQLDGAPENFTMKSNVTYNFLYLPDQPVHVIINGTVRKDTMSPAISILSPQNTTYSTDKVPLNFTIDESTSWIGYSLDGHANVTLSGDPTLFFLVDGAHHIVVYASDDSGNTGVSSIVYFATDSNPPDITGVSQTPAEDNVLPEDTVQVNATVTDDGSGVKQVALNYTTDDGTWITLDMTNLDGNVWTATIPAFPYCTNVTYMIIAEDNVGYTITTEELGYEYEYHVIPEFSTWTFLLLLFITLTAAVAIYKRRLRNATIH